MPKEEEKKRIRPVIEEITGETNQPAEKKEGKEEKKEEEKVSLEENLASQQIETETQFPLESIAQEKKLPQEVEKKPTPTEKKTNTYKILLIVLMSALIVGLVAGGIYVYLTGTSFKQEGQPSSAPMPTPMPTLAPTASPEASPGAEIDFSEYRISVLNGSGKIGEAGKVEDLLVEAGIEVAKTGNAQTFDFEATQIQAKESIPQAAIDQLEEILAEKYTVEIGDPLKDSNSYDLVITVGLE